MATGFGTASKFFEAMQNSHWGDVRELADQTLTQGHGVWTFEDGSEMAIISEGSDDYSSMTRFSVQIWDRIEDRADSWR